MRETGYDEGKLNIQTMAIKNMLKEKVEIEKIAKYMNLSIKEVNDLIK